MTIESGTVADAPFASVAFSVEARRARRRRRAGDRAVRGKREPGGQRSTIQRTMRWCPCRPWRSASALVDHAHGSTRQRERSRPDPQTCRESTALAMSIESGTVADARWRAVA